MPQKVMFVFGTRPEAIKLCPVVHHFKKRPKDFDVVVCVTAQHREMLDQVLEIFEVKADYDLNLMKKGQDLFDITANVIQSMKPVLDESAPDWIIVQGDTTTVWTAALCAFYSNIRVGHVEAGLRTYDKHQPFPEEINRRLCSQLTDVHFAPTELSKDNLLREGFDGAKIAVTGNTVIDALHWVIRRNKENPDNHVKDMDQWLTEHVGDRRMVLVTGHRRESFGEGFENICFAIKELANKFTDVEWVYPVHLNPNVQEPVNRILAKEKNIHLIEPLPYTPFAWLLSRASIVLTDSGGIQEEAPSLGKPVLVMRNTTERPEGIKAGCVKLVGNDKDCIIEEVSAYLMSGEIQQDIKNPYGDGHASERIAEGLLAYRE